MVLPEMWAEFASISSISRTTNACESFLAELNAMFSFSYSLKIICRYVYIFISLKYTTK